MFAATLVGLCLLAIGERARGQQPSTSAFLTPAELTPAIRPPTAAEARDILAWRDGFKTAVADGRWQAAEDYARRLMSVYETTFGPEHPQTAEAMGWLAQALRRFVRYREADDLDRRALEIDRRALGETHPLTATAYSDLAYNLDAQGRYREAEPLYRLALQIRSKALGKDHADTITDDNNLAYNLTAQGRYREAEPLYRDALDSRRRILGEAHAETATSYNNLAVNLDNQGRFTEAEPLLRRALDIRRDILGEESPGTATAYSNLAANLDNRGLYRDAEFLLRKALDIRRKVLGPENVNTANSYHNLAYNLRVQARYAEAEPLYRTALEIRLKALGEEHPRTATAYSSLASNLLSAGRPADAEPIARKALDIRRKVLGDDHPQTAISFDNLARALDGQGRHSDAESLLRKALAIRVQILGEGHPDTAVGYDNLAANLQAQGRFTEAESYASQAVSVARRVRAITAGQDLSGEQASLLRARAGNGDGPEPLREIYGGYLSIAFDASRQTPAREAELRDKAFQAGQDYTASAAAQAMALSAARAAAGDGPLGALVRQQQSLAGQARALDEQLQAALGKDRATEQRLRAEQARILADLAAADLRLAKDFPAYAQLVQPGAVNLAKAQAALAPDEGLVMILAAADDVYSFSISRQGIAWSRLANGAPGVAQRAAALRRAMGGGNGTGQRLTPRPFEPATAYSLYRDVFAPVEGGLGARVKRLYIVAAGPLADVPLGMLMTAPPRSVTDGGLSLADPDAPFLAERYAISVLPSVSSLGTHGRADDPDAIGGATAKSGGERSFVGYGAPNVSGALDEGVSTVAAFANGRAIANRRWVDSFTALPGTRDELAGLAKGMRADASRDVHLGSEAREETVRRDPALAQAQVIAFATHGFTRLQARELGEPGLVLTPPGLLPDKPATPDDDGVLTASEVASLSFQADWVLLSACDTASSDGSGGESLSSLSRAVLYAGADALLASHWPVDDRATALLTTQAISLRAANPSLTRAQSLTLAMHILRTGKLPNGQDLPGWTTAWAQPLFWAPFSIFTHKDE